MKYFWAIALAACLCGCSVFGPATPTTTLTMQIGKQKASWTCPKQFTATNIVFKVETNGSATLQVDAVSSLNDPAVVDKSYAGQALIVKQWGDTATQLIQVGAQVAALAVTNAHPSTNIVVKLPPLPPVHK